MAWIYLFLGGLFEIGWPLGFKLAHGSSGKILWITFSVLSMALSGLFLFMAQKHMQEMVGLSILKQLHNMLKVITIVVK